MKLAPLHTYRQFWGDPRYTPWVVKFLLFSPMAQALAMMMAMLYLMVRCGPLDTRVLLVVFLLLSSIGLLYPLLFPPACGIVAVRALSLLAEKQNRHWTHIRGEWLALSGMVLIAALLTYAEVRFLTAERRITTHEVLLSTVPSAARKVFASVIATAVLLAGLAFTRRDCWKSRRTATVFLLAGALASCFLYAAFHIPYYENEYKFVFPITMCLAVFPALAVEGIWKEWTRPIAACLLVLLGLFLFGTYGYWTYVGWPSPRFYLHYPLKFEPPLDTGEFHLRLNKQDAWSGICTAAGRMTPADTVLVVNNGTFYLPGFTDRSLYVAPSDQNFAGVNHGAAGLDGEVRGYGTEILEQRRAVLTAFFEAQDANQREQALNEILALKRPVAVIAEPRYSDLFAWLQHQKTATELYAANGLSLWLIDETSDGKR